MHAAVRGDITVEWAKGGTVCGLGLERSRNSTQPAVLNCSKIGGVIDAIVYANYGTTNGSCHGFTADCVGDDSRAVVEKLCIGKSSCAIPASWREFAHGGKPYDPCPGVVKTVTVEARCSALFSLRVSLPVGVGAASVLLPLTMHASSAVNVSESGALIWMAGSFRPGAVAGVRSAAPYSGPPGSGLEVIVGSGTYNFVVE